VELISGFNTLPEISNVHMFIGRICISLAIKLAHKPLKRFHSVQYVWFVTSMFTYPLE